MHSGLESGSTSSARLSAQFSHAAKLSLRCSGGTARFTSTRNFRIAAAAVLSKFDGVTPAFERPEQAL
jgi:hypothetical protein